MTVIGPLWRPKTRYRINARGRAALAANR